MSAIDRIIAYILKLNHEQVDEVKRYAPKGRRLTKDETVAKIVVLLKECNDIPLLDLIYRLLGKSI